MDKRSQLIKAIAKKRAKGDDGKYKEEYKMLSQLSTELLILLFDED